MFQVKHSYSISKFTKIEHLVSLTFTLWNSIFQKGCAFIFHWINPQSLYLYLLRNHKLGLLLRISYTAKRKKKLGKK